MVDVAFSSGKESDVRVLKLAPRWFVSNSTNRTLLLQPFISSVPLGNKEIAASNNAKCHEVEAYVTCPPGGLHAAPTAISCWSVDEPYSKALAQDPVLNVRVKFLNDDQGDGSWSLFSLGAESSLKECVGAGGVRRHVAVGSRLLTVACTRAESGVASYLAFGVEKDPPVVVHNLFAKHSFRFAGVLSAREYKFSSGVPVRR
jgi:hypothetical protein